MRAVLRLTWHAPWRRADGDGGARLLTLLAVLAFAVTTTFGLSVVGGLRAFERRAANPTSNFMAEQAGAYVVLAWIAVVLLVVPLLSLGGAAARLGVSRRNARLATLRLLGVTPREVVGLTVAETAAQGLAGAVLGVGGYVLVLPVWTGLSFLGERLTTSEMWVGVPVLLAALAVVPVAAAVSGAASLRQVVVSPLGVARRVTPPGLRWVRALAVVVAVAVFVVATQVLAGFGTAVFVVVLLVLLGGVFGTLALVGPWLVALLGKAMAALARTPATMLAARRLLDDPRASWRVVGGLGLASFVAGCVSVLPAMVAASGHDDPEGRMLMGDMLTGGMLTLAIAFVVAATSAGIAQAAAVLDRRQGYALQHLAGVPPELFDAARRREVLGPLLLVSVTSAGVGLVLLLPFFGLAGATDPTGLLVLAACLTAGVLLMVAATETSRPLLRSVLRETVVRAD